MRERLAHLERARREFIQNASHELRTPLFSLGGFLELLEDEDLDEATRREFLAETRGPDRSPREARHRSPRPLAPRRRPARRDRGRTSTCSTPSGSSADEFRPAAESTGHDLRVDRRASRDCLRRLPASAPGRADPASRTRSGTPQTGRRVALGVSSGGTAGPSSRSRDEGPGHRAGRASAPLRALLPGARADVRPEAVSGSRSPRSSRGGWTATSRCTPARRDRRSARPASGRAPRTRFHGKTEPAARGSRLSRPCPRRFATTLSLGAVASPHVSRRRCRRRCDPRRHDRARGRQGDGLDRRRRETVLVPVATTVTSGGQGVSSTEPTSPTARPLLRQRIRPGANLRGALERRRHDLRALRHPRRGRRRAAPRRAPASSSRLTATSSRTRM